MPDNSDILLLLLGVFLTGLLLPALARRWQDRQREVELKIGLVSDLSKAIMEIIVAVEWRRCPPSLTGNDEPNTARQEFDKARRAWAVAHRVIHTKLEAYFDRTEIHEEWNNFSAIVTAICDRAAAPNKKALPDQELDQRDMQELDRIYTKLSVKLPAPPRADGGGAENWDRLKSAVVTVKAALIERIHDSPILVFHSAWSLRARSWGTWLMRRWRSGEGDRAP